MQISGDEAIYMCYPEKPPMSHLQQDTPSLQPRMKPSREEYRTCDTVLQRDGFVVSPALLLPPELVQKIFFDSVSDLPIQTPWSPLHPPLLLTQICSGWRTLALHTPELWTDFLFQANEPKHMRVFQDVAQCWFSRCSTRTMSLKFSSKLQSTVLSTTLSHILYENSQNIRHLDIDVVSSFFTEFSRFSEESFPHLQSIHLRGTPMQSRQDAGDCQLWSPNTTTFRHAPKLNDVIISVPCTTLDLEHINLPWPQLTKLDLGDTVVLPGAVLGALASCTNLAFFSARLAADNGTSTASSLTLPSLTDLSLFMIVKELPAFLQFLTLPSLANLSLKLVPGASWDPDALVRLISRSGCELQSLTISCCGMDSDGFRSLIQVLPALKALDMTFLSFMTDEILSGIIPEETHENPPLPLLQHVKWKERSLKCTPQCIHRFIASRGWGSPDSVPGKAEGASEKVARLRSFIIKSAGCQFGVDWMQNLQVFKERGLEVTYGTR